MSERDREVLLRRGLWLEGLTILWNVIEAAVAIGAGWIARSIALLGFGFDTAIEIVAAAVLFRRLTAEARGVPPQESRLREHQALRIVGITYFILSAYIVYASLRTVLSQDEAPDRSPLGIAVALAALGTMPVLAWSKYRVGEQLASRALVAEAKESLVCAYLSFTLLLGLGGNALLGWWWADPAAALAMVPFLIHEGWEAVQDARGA